MIERARRAWTFAAVAALAVGALGLRVVLLRRHPFWFDEAFSLMLITYVPVRGWRFDVHPPLYYALLWAWSRLSTTDAWLRLLSALLGAATIPAVYALGKRLLGRAGGLWAAAFLAVTWFHVWYSREARMYPLLVLGFALALWGMVAGARDGAGAGWLVYALAGAAVAWSHALGVYYAAILAGLALLVPRGEAGWSGSAGTLGSRRSWVVSTLALIALCAPWAPIFAARGREVAASFWVPPPSPEPPLLSTVHDFTVSTVPSPAALLRARTGIDLGAALGAWVWMVPLLGALGLALVLGDRGRRRVAWFLALAYGLPIVLFTVASLVVRPILIPRILLPAAVPMVLLLAAGVVAVPGRRGRAVAGLTVGGVLLLGAVYGLRYGYDFREGWREASEHVQAHARPGDVLFDARGTLDANPRFRNTAQIPSTAEFLFLRYDPMGRLRSLPWVSVHRVAAGCFGPIGPCLDRAFASVPPGARVWYVRRGAYVTAGAGPWVEARLDRERVLDFGNVFVEETRLLPPGAR